EGCLDGAPALAASDLLDLRHRLQYQDARSLPGGSGLRAALPAGRSPAPPQAHWTPGLSRGAAAGHLALLGGRRRPHPGLAAALCRLHARQFGTESGPWLQWHPALAGQFWRVWRRLKCQQSPKRHSPQFGNGGSPNTGGIGAGQQPPSGGSGGGGGIGGLFAIGTPGALRLFTQPLAGQIAWLLPFALLGAVALAWQRRPRWQSDRQQQSLLLWGMWLLTMGIFFSVASFFHQYYFTVMAPAIAALFGVGVVTMWQDYRRGGRRGWLLPIALVAAVAEQVYILSQYPTWGQWLIPPLVVLGGIAVGALLIARLAPRWDLKAPGRRFLVPALTAGVLVLMLAPTVWAAIPILTSKEADTLVAGPTQTTSIGGNVGGGQSANASSDAALIRYLEDHQGTAKYLVAVLSSKGADAIILATNKPVMTLG